MRLVAMHGLHGAARVPRRCADDPEASSPYREIALE